MSDPITTVVLAAGGVIASKDILDKLLGPTAEYLGEGTLGIVKKSRENLERVFRTAYEKLKGQLDKPEQVSPRVLKHVCDEGRFVEDVFCAEYFGGMLASSRSPDGKDEGAIPFLSLVKSMSSRQMRLHFIIYALLAKSHFSPPDTESKSFWLGLQLEIPHDELARAMDLSGYDGERELLLALAGLIDQQLLRDDSLLKSAELPSSRADRTIEGDVVVVGPNERGARLFLRALGCRGLSPELITSINVEYSLSDTLKAELRLPQGANCRNRAPSDPLKELQKEFESQLWELESTLIDVKSALDDRKKSSKSAVAETDE